MEDDELLAHYIEIGVIEIAGMQEDGELIFAINDSAKELAPELWQAHSEYVDDTLVELYEEGYITVEYNENLEAMIGLSPEGIKIAKEKGILPMEMPDAPNN